MHNGPVEERSHVSKKQKREELSAAQKHTLKQKSKVASLEQKVLELEEELFCLNASLNELCAENNQLKQQQAFIRSFLEAQFLKVYPRTQESAVQHNFVAPITDEPFDLKADHEDGYSLGFF